MILKHYNTVAEMNKKRIICRRSRIKCVHFLYGIISKKYTKQFLYDTWFLTK